MFTGIVQGSCQVKSVIQKSGLVSFALELSECFLDGLMTGASISVDGVCLTVVEIRGEAVSFDAIGETLKRTTLGSIHQGQKVNVERSVKLGDEIGGHLLSGHVMGIADIIGVDRPDNNHIVTFRVASEWIKYLIPKGFVALDGVSLTVVDVSHSSATFTVALIPETLRRTTFGFKDVGAKVNIELDTQTQVIVDAIEHTIRRLWHDLPVARPDRHDDLA